MYILVFGGSKTINTLDFSLKLQHHLWSYRKLFFTTQQRMLEIHINSMGPWNQFHHH